jgi:hypothetical protein
MRVPDMQGVVFWCVVALAVLFVIGVFVDIYLGPVTDGEWPSPPDPY